MDRVRTLLLVVMMTVVGRADAGGYIDDFVGWSKDGTFYVLTTSGTDEMNVPVMCLTKPDTPSPTWPKGIPVPDKDSGGCTDRWDMIFTDKEASQLVDQARGLVSATRPGLKGPHGETVTVKRLKGEMVDVVVTRGGKKIARDFIELKYPSFPVPSQVTTYWRPDGAYVAVVAGYPADPNAIGFGPPQFVIVAPLDGSTAATPTPVTRRDRAQALNIEGMKLLDSKQLDAAQKKFEASVDADDTFALGSYNLACAASLRKDKPAALAALRHLDMLSGEDPVAKKALAKGLTDHDLDFIATDPEGAKLLKRAKK